MVTFSSSPLVCDMSRDALDGEALVLELAAEVLKVRRQKMIAMAKHSVTATASLRHMYGYTVVRHCWLSKTLRQTRNLVYCLMRPRN